MWWHSTDHTLDRITVFHHKAKNAALPLPPAIRAENCQMNKVVILPVNRVEPIGIDLARQPLLPAADRRNVVELWRLRLDRAFQQLDRVLANGYRPGGDCG